MPNLEDLKNQARQYLRWHRDRYYPVAEQIRAMLPSYRHLSDREVLDHPFKQSDAQELIARKAGFESWKALREGSQPSADPQAETVRQATLLAAEPQLFVADIAASCEFYVQMLGFAVAFTYGKPPFYGQVFRQGARLNLRCLDQPGIDPERRDREQLLSASIALDDARPLFLEYQAAGVVFAQPLRTEPWGARTFIVDDPDGNLILFADPGKQPLGRHPVAGPCSEPTRSSAASIPRGRSKIRPGRRPSASEPGEPRSASRSRG